MAVQISKRLLADIAELQQPLYAESGIFYIPNESNTFEGVACVFGPQDSPYEDCPMVYRFELPKPFPFDSPKVTFHTHDGRTRFHPNMYVDGKCCLSILGTWSGPPWASTMRISTILVTLQSLMDNDPLRHEPGYSSGTRDDVCKMYTCAVEVACIRYCLHRVEELQKGKPLPVPLQPFQAQFQERIPGMLGRFVKRLEARMEGGEKEYPSIPYGMSIRTNYAQLMEWVLRLRGTV
jgi:ubiquitin-protein ligase